MSESFESEPEKTEQRPGSGVVQSISPRTELMLLILIAIFLYLVRIILLPFVFAGAVAFVCMPAVDWLAKRGSSPRWAAASAVFLWLVGLTILIGSFAAPVFLHEFVPLVSDLGGTLTLGARHMLGNRTVNILGQPMNAEEISQQAVLALRSWLGQNGEIFGLASMGFTGLFGIILLFVLLFYFLVGGPQLADSLFWLVPPNQRPMTRYIWGTLEPILRRYFIGIAVVVTYAATAAYIGLGLVLGLSHALVLALITGVLELIPVAGPALSAALAGLVAIQTATGVGNIIGYTLYAIALRLSIDQLIGPLVLGHAAQLHPVQIIFCFFAGGVLFGIPGLILAVPLALTAKVVLATLYGEPLTTDDRRKKT
ncbi:MAG TPA: AI-2E family transporter [Methylocella sp.]|nr:AI-2E family transporter [Methylocella sp.]